MFDAERLLAQDPDNTMNMEITMGTFEEMALLEWREGRSAQATRQFDRAQEIVAELMRRDAKNVDWNIHRPASIALLRALTERSGRPAAELSSIASNWLGKLDPKDPGQVWQIIAAHIVNAVAASRRGDPAAAASAYARAIAVEPIGEGVNVNADALRAVAAERLGQVDLARQLKAVLREKNIDVAIDDRIPGS